MSGNKTTNITNTGLGDTQFDQLQKNQTGLGTQIEEGFSGAGTKLDNLSTGVTGLGSSINTGFGNVDTGFANLNTYLADQFGKAGTQRVDLMSGLGKGILDLNTFNQNRANALGQQVTDLSSDLTTGFNEGGKRFDALDTSISDVQTGVDSANTGLETMSAEMGTRFDTTDKNFTAAGEALTKGFTDTQAGITAAQAENLKGQGDIISDLETAASDRNTYFDTLSGNQATMLDNQNEYASTFDTYVDRYGQDTELAQQTRADLATAQANQTDRLREDLGNFAQSAAQGQTNLSQQIGTLGSGIDTGFQQLGSDVGTGFASASLADQTAQQALSIRLGNVRDLIQTTADTIGVETKQQYQTLANSFDENGNLIANAIDEQGNTISRAMDDQGNVIERKLDANGNEISAVQMNVGTMLDNAEQYERSLLGQIDKRFDTAEANTGTELRAIASGFNVQDKKLDTQARDLSRIAAEQTDLDVTMRNEFRELGNAFDDQGNLIQNSISDNGTSISRAVDDNGNLLLRAFDAGGNRVGDQVININQSLNSLSNLDMRQGANVSMGNLSPAMSADTPNTGFASPYAMTG